MGRSLTEVKSNDQIYGFDVLKMLMALCIVAIHVKPFEGNPILSRCFSPLLSAAVPVFFILSSFFLFRKLNSKSYDLNILLNWLKRIGTLYLFWLIVNLPFVIHDRLDRRGESVITLVWYSIRDLFFASTFSGSWFLSALIFGVVFCYLIKKYLKANNVIFLSISVLVNIFLNYHSVCPTWVNGVYDWIAANIHPEVELTVVSGILWCSIGCVLASDSCIHFLNRVKSYNNSILILILFVILSWAMRIYITDTLQSELRIGLSLSLYALFFCIKLPESSCYKTLRSFSILFYFQHFIWLHVYAWVFSSRFAVGGKYLIITALCFIGASIIVGLSKKKYFKWLKYSY